MPSEFIITEKTSQAKDVQAAVGSKYGPALPAEGHLFDLEEPAEKKWEAKLLVPPNPNGLYKTVPASGGNKASKLKAIREALKGAKRVWLATDCDREGQLIGQEILDHYGYKGEVMRVMFTAQDPKTIQDAFKNAKPNSEYRALYAAAVARREADQRYNLSMTRTATVVLNRGGKGVVGVGRVKTIALAIVCRRELEILNFKPVNYFEIVVQARSKAGLFKMRHAPKERILKREDAEAIAAKADGFRGPLSVKVESKKQAPPRLHDLPSLQKLCGSRFGWSAEKTLEVAQALYNDDGKKIITYPRAETRYLAESLIPDAPKLVAGLMQGGLFGKISVPNPPIIRKGKEGHFYDKGLAGASHHAVIPNVNVIGDLGRIWPRLSDDEKKLFDVIARSYLAAVMPDFLYRQTTVLIDVKGSPFRASGRQPLDLGWKAAFGQEEDEDGDDDKQLLPPLQDGQLAVLQDPKVEAKETKPPPRYNEGTLIADMQDAWKFVPPGPVQERLKEAKGVGTPATRGEVIKGLKSQDQLRVQGKHIVPTERGMAIYKILGQADRALVDPGFTAQLELVLDDVMAGSRTMMDAIGIVCTQAERIIERLVANAPPLNTAGDATGAGLPGSARPPTDAMRKFVEDLAQKKGIKPPADYKKSGDVCRAFLDQHAPKKDAQNGVGSANGGTPGAATPAQIAFAEKLAAEKGVAIPDDARASVRAMSAWIEATKGGGASGGKSAGGAAKSGQASKSGSSKAAGTSGARGAAPDLPAGATALKIPFGNKDVAFQLGAKYQGGWYAPPGANLDAFRERGWL